MFVYIYVCVCVYPSIGLVSVVCLSRPPYPTLLICNAHTLTRDGCKMEMIYVLTHLFFFLEWHAYAISHIYLRISNPLAAAYCTVDSARLPTVFQDTITLPSCTRR